MTGVVASITYAPVKGLGLSHVDEVELELTGVRENRRFYLIGEDGRLVNGKVAGPLVRVAATADHDGTLLVLRFPDGSTVDGPVELGDPVETNFYGRPVAGRVVLGGYARRSVGARRATARARARGRAGSRLRSRLRGNVSPSCRQARSRRWPGRRERRRSMPGASGCCSGSRASSRTPRTPGPDAASRSETPSIRLHGLVGRCLVTAQDPDTGVKTLDTLRIIRGYRSDVETDEPLPFGSWGGVEQPGRVRLGDTVEPL